MQSEVQATKAAWPLIIDGLPADIRKLPRGATARRVERASALHLPSLFEEGTPRSLTGPGGRARRHVPQLLPSRPGAAGG